MKTLQSKFKKWIEMDRVSNRVETVYTDLMGLFIKNKKNVKLKNATNINSGRAFVNRD